MNIYIYILLKQFIQLIITISQNKILEVYENN